MSARVGLRPALWLSQGPDTFQRALGIGALAEELGFDGLFFGDRMLAEARHRGRAVYRSTHPDVLTLMAAFAARTTRVELGSLVLVVPFRHPVALAKSIASIDLLSSGRVILGVGGGWNPEEFAALGVPRAEAGRRLEEGLEIMRRLWREDHVDYDGRVFTLRDVSIDPKPVRPGGPPLWFGSLQPPRQMDADAERRLDRVLRRIGRLADAWAPMSYSAPQRHSLEPELLGRLWERVRAAAAEAGRTQDAVSYVFSHWFHVVVEDSDRRACEEALRGFFAGTYEEAVNTYLIGTPDEIVRKIERLTTHVEHVAWYVFTPLGSSPRQVELLAERVLPYLRDR